MMMAEQQQAGPLAAIAALLAPGQSAPRAVRAAHVDPIPADAGWDEMVRWFAEQREWAELVATYADATPSVAW